MSRPPPVTVKVLLLALAIPREAGFPTSPEVQGVGNDDDPDPRSGFSKVAVVGLLGTWLVTARPT